jgi:AT-rich interactive domain-containing protein 2
MTYKFLLLISYCENKIELQKYAFDIWTNLALHMHLRLISDDEGQLIRQLLNSMLNGDENSEQQDRFKIIRGLEILSNLARAGNDNGNYLIDFIDIIIQRLLHISDILVLVHTLECLYQLSELGEYLCNAILKVQTPIPIITTLIDLLTIEARSFSSQTIKTIKIVEMSTGPVLLPSYHQPPLTQQTTNVAQSVVVIPANQQQTYAIENTEINKSYYSNNNKLIIQQQYSKPMTVANVISSGNLLAVATPSTTPIIVANTNAQTNQMMDKKRKHDCKLFFGIF